MAQGLFDDQTIDIPCPECGHEIEASIGELKRNPDLTCVCGQTIAVDADELVKELAEAEKALANLTKGFTF